MALGTLVSSAGATAEARTRAEGIPAWTPRGRSRDATRHVLAPCRSHVHSRIRND